LSDDGERTTAAGLFNYAHTYWQSAVALQEAQVKATHPDSPIWFLYYHAIELYLKAYLRGLGDTAKELRTKYGHRVVSLSAEAKRRGLFLEDGDENVFSLLTDTNDILAYRYIQRGYFRRPTHEALDRTCTSLHQSVGEALQTLGIKVHV
jgi:hypothetical protein